MTLYDKSYHLNKSHQQAIKNFWFLKAGFYCILPIYAWRTKLDVYEGSLFGFNYGITGINGHTYKNFNALLHIISHSIFSEFWLSKAGDITECFNSFD